MVATPVASPTANSQGARAKSMAGTTYSTAAVGA